MSTNTKFKKLFIGGGGSYFFWQVGVLRYLQEHYNVEGVELVGASAGGLLATLTMCRVDLDKAVEKAHQLSVDYGIYERRLGLAGIWSRIVHQWLDELLPNNAADLCRERVSLKMVTVPSLKAFAVDDWQSRQDLIDGCLASCFIPIFMGPKLFMTYRNIPVIDGALAESLHDKFSSFFGLSNSLGIAEDCYSLDYKEDVRLNPGRFSFLKMRKLEEVKEMMNYGYQFAANRKWGFLFS